MTFMRSARRPQNLWRRVQIMRHIITCLVVILAGLSLWVQPVFAVIEVGSPAPAFCLPTQDGESVCLEEFKDKQNVLLLFYILDFTPG